MLCDPRSDRIRQLSARVQWLDRHRRALAICVAAIIAPLVMSQVVTVLGADWPQMHTTMLSLLFGGIVWWMVEIGLIYVTALWETEHADLVRTSGVPRAVVYQRRRRG
jgi:polyferredoxin